MARMIPSDGPRDFDTSSREGEIYSALKQLSDDYVVVHSLRLVSLSGGSLRDNEADFVIFNKSLGILCIEAKAGRVYYEEGVWYYGGGSPMPHGGPFNQAANAKYRLMDAFNEKGLGNILRRCRMHHAVWFPSISDERLKGATLAPEAERSLIFLRQDLLDPSNKIREIMSIEVGSISTELSDRDADLIIKRILCPAFDLIPSRRLKYDLADISFLRLLESQKRILDFLIDQRTAVINGVAGSGKTLIAVERARQLAERGERVLFICYNAMLKDDIKERCRAFSTVDVYTIAGYACKVCHTATPDYELLALKLLEQHEDDSFPYRHVVIDEGQDFGVDALEQADILATLNELVKEKDGTFYLFYDKNQLIQGSGLPQFIDEADCKLTLYVNCRNTKNIALSSTSALQGSGNCITKKAATAGTIPKLFVSTEANEQIAYIDREIQALRRGGIENIVILTCSTESKSLLNECIIDGYWKDSTIPFYTCRKFKGLEADAIILIDVNADLWVEDENAFPCNTPSGLIFYTGASRARHELRIVCDLTEAECLKILEKLGVSASKRPFQALAKALHAKAVR